MLLNLKAIVMFSYHAQIERDYWIFFSLIAQSVSYHTDQKTSSHLIHIYSPQQVDR